MTAALLVLATLISCSRESSKDAHLSRSSFRADLETWSLPLDAYTVPPDTEGYAESLLYSACMKQHDFDVPAENPADYLPPNKNQQQFKLFNLTFAQKYGYHNGPAKLLPSLPPQFTAAEQSQDQVCNQQAEVQIGANDTLTAFVQGLGVEAYETSEHASNVIAAVAAWRKCMLPLGVPDLQDVPDDMPSPSQRVLFGLNPPADADPNVLPPLSKPSPNEIRQAVFDANCRDSTEYSQTLYGDQVQTELTLIDKNQEELSRALAAEQAEAATVAKILQQYGR